MNITEVTGTWRITPGQIENRKTGEVRRVEGLPSANEFASMPWKSFERKMPVAFATGVWPLTHWSSGRTSNY